MFKKFLNILLIIPLLLLCSCSKEIIQDELFSFYYDFQFYGFDTAECALKGSTVSTLKDAIDNKKTTVFLISTPICSSCKEVTEIVNDIALKHNITVYDIDPNSSQYPVYNTDDFNTLLDIVKNIGINGESEFSIPILLVINNGEIESFFKDYDHNSNITYEQLYESIDDVLSKSIIYK